MDYRREQEMPLVTQEVPQKIPGEKKGPSIAFKSVIQRSSSRAYSVVPTHDPPEPDGGHLATLDRRTLQSTPSSPSPAAPHGLFSGGWRSGCSIFAIVSVATFLTNLIFTVWAHLRTPLEPDGVRTLFRGKCKEVASLNSTAHVFINILSTVLLSGSNYTMQCLSSPTRKDIDEAHKSKKWLDIGVLSIRNLRRTGIVRPAMWCLLCMSSLPLHFVYNSVIVSTITTYDYSVDIMSELGVHGDTTGFKNLTTADCISYYGKQFVSDRSDVVIVVSGDTPANRSGFEYNQYDYIPFMDSQPYDWICQFNPVNSGDFCDIKNALSNIGSWKINGTNVTRCLSKPEQERCALQFSTPMMVIVLCCNAVKSICILSAILWGKGKDEPLVTIGDAIFSFLNNPDETTVNMPIVTKQDFKSGIWKHEARETRRSWRPHKARWFRAAGLGRWSLCYLLSLIAMCAAIGGFTRGYTLLYIPRLQSLSFLWSLGVGGVNTYFINPPWGFFFNLFQSELIASVICANLPQAIFSSLYFLYNSLFTCMLFGKEWDEFSDRWRPLRVTRPIDEKRPASRGPRSFWSYLFRALSFCTKYFQNLRPARPKDRQGSTYFLQLPYRYSLPLIAASSLLHWLISQSYFVVRVDNLDSQSNSLLIQSYPFDSYSGGTSTLIGWSPVAIILGILLSAVLLVLAIVFGLREYRGNIPLVGSCSAAISAACHPGSPQVPIGVMWGVRESDGNWALSDRKG